MQQALIEWSGVVLGVAGSSLLAVRSPRWSKWGFVAYLASNFLWIAWGISHEAWGVVIQNLTFMITSVIGIVTWFGRRQIQPWQRLQERLMSLASRLPAGSAMRPIRRESSEALRVIRVE
jgi:hypothetical protein